DAVVLNTKTIKSKGLLGFLKKPLVEITAAFEDKDILQRNPRVDYDNKLRSINDELVELKNLMLNLSHKSEEKELFPPQLDRIHQVMVDNGINPSISLDILKDIGGKVDLEMKDMDTIRKIVMFNLSEKLGNPEPLTVDTEQKIAFFVGSTGVGKTTTLAKIAANFVLNKKYKVGLITLDTYRIAAVEQLKIYSEILQLPLKIAYNKNDLVKSLDEFKDKDIILIDTAGRSHNDKYQLEELKEILESVDKKEIFLLLDATVDHKVLSSIVDNYSFIDDYRLIVTKVDEAKNFGNLINIKYITNKELSYYTVGQNVPDDIQTVDIKEIVENICRENIDD
ncbi:MAG: flagellar biosynthesis protein FlhF, partial [Tissierellaceae bacterium]